MAVRKTTGMLIYNLLMKEVSAANKQLPPNKKLSVRERYNLVSSKIYPKFKGLPKSKIKLQAVRSLAQWHVKRSPEKTDCDVLLVPKELLDNIDYFAIDENIQRLSECIHVKVNGNGFGATNIFYTADYNYVSSGVAGITNRINQWLRNLTKSRGVYPAYDGIIQVRKGRKNDGQTDSYYIEYILKGGKEQIPYEEVKIPEPAEGKRIQRQRKERAKRAARKRVLELQKEKAEFKQLRKRFSVGVDDFKIFLKEAKRNKLKINPEKLKKSKFITEKRKANKYLKNGKLTKPEFQQIIRIITTGYDQ